MNLRLIRKPVSAMLAGLALTLGATAAHAQTATVKPVRIILVGDSTMAPNGGYGDAMCRRLPQTTCINRGSAGRSSSSP